MDTRENESTEINTIADIELRLAQGKEVSTQDMLQFFRAREAVLSTQLKSGDTNAFGPLESIREQIQTLNESIQPGEPGTGTTGQSSRRAAHNTPGPVKQKE